MNKKVFPLITLSLVTGSASAHQEHDKFMWLENIESARAMTWVKEHNQKSLKEIQAYPRFDALVANGLAVYNSKERIPYASRRGDYLYNFWKDENHVRGIYRRTTMEEYLKPNPKWETVLDIDALGKKEGFKWVYKGMNCQYPENLRCFVSLSRGGADATEIREFDLSTKSFVPESQNPFFLPEAKSDLSWIDKDTVFVGTDFGDNNSMTDSGYPRVVKIWKRGQPLSEAKEVFAGEKKSVSSAAFTLYDDKTPLHLVGEFKTFYTSRYNVYHNGKLTALPLPEDAEIKGYFNGDLFIELKSDLTSNGNKFPQGSVVFTPADALIRQQPDYQLFIAPTKTASISSVSFTKSAVFVNWLDNVKSKLVRYELKAGKWHEKTAPFNENGTLSVFDVKQDKDDFFVTYTSFLEPASLYRVNANTLSFTKVKAMPRQFAADKFKTQQYFATSADGTKIPYFVVMAKDAKLDGKNPTLLYGYGGFEVSLRPSYSAMIGKNWLEQGGVYVLSNIRGGGEYGPSWHQAALKKNRHKAYEDFEAIAEDLIARKITSSKHLGIQGGSNGGLLMGAAFTRRPDLYNAVVCQVPLLDMKRFNKLLAGASWMGEYGNPDNADEWEYLKTYSPYHNLKKDTAYPKVFFTTSTRDDRVHPGHARKMVAKMEDMGFDVLYYENIEGGHAGAADNTQAAKLRALTYAYLMQQLR